MPRFPDNDVAAHITKLACLSVGDLRAEWTRVFGSSSPKNAQREYLLRAITYRLQCDQFGGLSLTVTRGLRKLCGGKAEAPKVAVTPTRTLKPGARILREWKGAVHEVEVVDDGYRYRQETYKSLSVIARRITGTRWSGPVFFGLKKGQAEAHHGL